MKGSIILGLMTTSSHAQPHDPDLPDDLVDTAVGIPVVSDQTVVEPADAGLNLQDPAVVIDLFTRAAQAHLDTPHRKGATIRLPAQGRLLMTGDIHDHGLNYQRVIKFARLDQSVDNHLVIHELVHGEARINGRDLSVRLLAKAAALKLKYPNQVYHLQSNHELAQISGEGIVKYGVSVVESFNAGVNFIYGDQAAAVNAAIEKYVRSLPLAIHCPNGILCSHSLPGPRKLLTFDHTVLNRQTTSVDLSPNGHAYNLVWGRDHTRELLDTLADAWRVNLFVTGHQPADWGYEVANDLLLIIASDHEHGVCLPIQLDKQYTMESLIGQIVPLAAIVL